MTNGTRRGWGVSVTPRSLFTPGKDPVPIVQEAGWVSGPVWTGAENLAPTGIRSPDRPARRPSLYRLSYRSTPVHIQIFQSLYSLWRHTSIQLWAWNLFHFSGVLNLKPLNHMTQAQNSYFELCENPKVCSDHIPRDKFTIRPSSARSCEKNNLIITFLPVSY
jgi:hypothetical protein